jgi:hypothetical protein
MTNYQIIKTNPTDSNFHLFEKLPSILYPEGSERFRLGHEPAELFLEGCYVLLKDNLPVGRFAFYENLELVFKDEKSCNIGSYECENNSQSSLKLIEFAKEIAISKGYSWIIGPMEGSTWNSYRFSLNHDSPQFFMEPYHHLYYNNQFMESGFEMINSYTSNLVLASNLDAEKVTELEELNNKLGFTFRNIELDNYENELRKIAKLSLEGFTSNFLFTPISENDFVNKYLQMKPFIDPKLIWMIENKSKELHAYVFCVKDFFDAKKETLIIKTIVKKRDSNLKKLGMYTIYKINEMAIKNGFTKVIHAMMSEDNYSTKESEQNESEKYKKYALYGLKL